MGRCYLCAKLIPFGFALCTKCAAKVKQEVQR